jgi:hypothetical protein
MSGAIEWAMLFCCAGRRAADKANLRVTLVRALYVMQGWPRPWRNTCVLSRRRAVATACGARGTLVVDIPRTTWDMEAF